MCLVAGEDHDLLFRLKLKSADRACCTDLWLLHRCYHGLPTCRYLLLPLREHRNTCLLDAQLSVILESTNLISFPLLNLLPVHELFEIFSTPMHYSHWIVSLFNLLENNHRDYDEDAYTEKDQEYLLSFCKFFLVHFINIFVNYKLFFTDTFHF